MLNENIIIFIKIFTISYLLVHIIKPRVPILSIRMLIFFLLNKVYSLYRFFILFRGKQLYLKRIVKKCINQKIYTFKKKDKKMDSNSEVLIDNLYLKYTRTYPDLSYLAFLTTYGQLSEEAKRFDPSKQDDDIVLLSIRDSIIHPNHFYDGDDNILKVEPFIVNLNGYQIVYILLKRQTDRDDDLGVDAIILQMDETGKVHSLLQNPVPGKYRVIKFFIFSIPNVELKQLPSQYFEILKDFEYRHGVDIYDNITQQMRKKEDISVDSLLKLQNSNIILTNIPHIDINILTNLHYDFVVYLSKFSPYISELINSNDFLKEYLEKHYGEKITLEKSINISYKQWLDFILRNDNIILHKILNELILTGKYYLFSYLIRKWNYDVYYLDMQSIGKSQDIRMIDLLNIADDDTETIDHILRGAAETNIEWFEYLMNRFKFQPYNSFLDNILASNDLIILKYFQIKWNLSLTDEIMQGQGQQDFPIIIFLAHLFSGRNDYYDLIQYIFSTTLNVNYFRTVPGVVIETGHGVEINEEYFDQLQGLSYTLGTNVDERTIEFFFNDEYIIKDENGNDIKMRGLAMLSQLDEKYSFEVYKNFLDGLCSSGNLSLFVKYLEKARQIFSNNPEREKQLRNENLFTMDKYINGELRHIQNIINPQSVLHSNSLDMVKYFDELGLFDKVIEIYEEGVMKGDPNMFNPIGYTLNADNLEIFDYLAPKFLKWFGDAHTITESLYFGGQGILQFNPYNPLIYQLKERDLINVPYLIEIVLKNGWYPTNFIENIIWIFRLKPSDIEPILSKTKDNERFMINVEAVRSSLIYLKYLKE